MSKNQVQKGFTLVELAISLVIIGLLIGGMLKGRVLMQSARISATVSQATAIETATIAFRSTYNKLPGDMPNANNRLPNCSNCQTIAIGASGGSDDGIIGDINWNGRSMQSTVVVGTPPTRAENETLLYWAELNVADLLSGVSYNGSGTSGSPAQFGVHMPAARVGGGFGVSHLNGSTRPIITPLGTPSQGTLLTGTVLILNSTPTGSLTDVAGTAVLDPPTAIQIDSKLDDGLPTTGRVQAFGYTRGGSTDGCFSDVGGGAMPAYNESLSGLDCGIVYQIK